MTVMITGADGFVGMHLIQELVSVHSHTGNKIVAVVGPNGHIRTEQLANRNDAEIIWERLDLREENSISRLIRTYKPKEIYHLAGIALTHGISVERYFSINSVGAYHLAESVLHYAPECKFLLVSTGGVYEKRTSLHLSNEMAKVAPPNVYAVSKLSAEMLLTALVPKGLRLLIVRPFNHTGPGQKIGYVCSDWIERAANALSYSSTLKAPLHLSKIVRDFTDVRDVVKAYHMLMARSEVGKIVNVCSGKPTKLSDIIKIIAQLSGVSIEFQILNEGNTIDDFESDVLVGDNSQLASLTGWSPTIALDQTLSDMWNEQRESQ